MIPTKKIKSQPKQFIDRNPVEAITNIGAGVVQSFSTDVIKEGGSDFWKQMLGGYEQKKKHETQGDLKEGQELDLKKINPDIAPGLDYKREILYGSERISHQQTQILERQIESIVIELKRLAASSKTLEIQFKDVVVEQRIEKPGKYHQSFFEWMLVIIRAARTRVEDAGAWLLVVHSKKNKKQQQSYWNMFKKHGTTFGLSNERVVATQTG